MKEKLFDKSDLFFSMTDTKDPALLLFASPYYQKNIQSFEDSIIPHWHIWLHSLKAFNIFHWLQRIKRGSEHHVIRELIHLRKYLPLVVELAFLLSEHLLLVELHKIWLIEDLLILTHDAALAHLNTALRV